MKSGVLEPWPLRPLFMVVVCEHTWFSEFCLKMLEESTGLPDGRNSVIFFGGFLWFY